MMRCDWVVLAALLFLCVLPARAQEQPASALAPLPEGNTGIAAKYPGDAGIEKAPAVVFADGFETGLDKWERSYGDRRVTHQPENVHSGKSAVEFTLAWPRPDGRSNGGLQHLFQPGYDLLFYRYYAKFGKDTELYHGGTHNGGAIWGTTMETNNVKAGLRADGRNQFTARLDTWRPNNQIASPGNLCLYSYHPEQKSKYGDQLFPSGRILPDRKTSERPYSEDSFVVRPDIIPERDRWYCYEIMVKTNTPGQRDGRLAFWVDGKLAADFPHFRLRDAEELKANLINVSLYTQNRRVQGGCAMWYDDVVAATSYIGPMVGEMQSPAKP